MSLRPPDTSKAYHISGMTGKNRGLLQEQQIQRELNPRSSLIVAYTTSPPAVPCSLSATSDRSLVYRRPSPNIRCLYVGAIDTTP
jgi:hypothetical protein